jgi:hypothetical protein
VDIPRYSVHSCFGYRILQGWFKDISETLLNIVDLCGGPDLPCPTSSCQSHPNPEGPACVLSPNLKASSFTHEDYVAEEDMDEIIAKLQHEAEPIDTKPKVRPHCGPSTLLICLFHSRHPLLGKGQSQPNGLGNFLQRAALSL